MQRSTARKLNIFLINFFAISLLAYFFLNGGAYWKILRYNLFLHTFASDELKEGTILEVTGNAAAAQGGTEAGDRLATAHMFTLSIPKIEVNTPVVMPRETTKQGILASLEEGVGLYPGSADIGAPGRAVVLGHSSRASWYRGEYAYIFSLLHKLETFDLFYVTGGGKKYTYQIFANTVMTPQEANAFLATTPSDSEIDLITCYPVGSASKRTIIQAKLMSVENI